MTHALAMDSEVKLDEREEKARRAVKTFRNMQPMLSAFARLLTGNNRVVVEMSATSNGHTDGKKIFFRPPIELGESHDHVRKLCDKRDDNLQQRCPACAQRETVLATIFHEISHIAYDSFKPVTDADVVIALKSAIESSGSDYADKLRDKITSRPYLGYNELSAYLSPYLPLLVNGLEDARIERESAKARPGTKRMFEATVFKVFLDGVPTPTGETSLWRDAPLNAQATVALYVKSTGYNGQRGYADWFAPEVAAALDDEEITRLCRQVPTARSVADVWHIAFPVLDRMRELGFFLEDEKKEEDEDGEGDSSSGEGDKESDDQSGSGNSEGKGEVDNESGGSSDSSGLPDESEKQSSDTASHAGDSPERDGDAGDREGDDQSDEEELDTGADDGTGGVRVEGDAEATAEQKQKEYGDSDSAKAALIKWIGHEEKPSSVQAGKDAAAVDKAIIQGLYFETPSRNIYGVREHFYGRPIVTDGYNYSTAWDPDRNYGWSSDATGRTGDIETAESILGPALLKTRRAFSDNAKSKLLRNLKTGRVNARVLGKRAPLDDERLFHQKRRPGKRDYHVLMMLDISGSTIGTNLAIMKQAAWAQAELLSRAGISFAIYAETGNYWSYAERGNGMALDVYVIKEPGQPWDKTAKKALSEIGAVSANLDGHALEYCRKQVDQSKATDKIIIYYSDGKMPAENHDEELEILKREIRTCRRRDIILLGVGIRTDSPARHGLETVQLDSVADTHKVIQQLEKYIERKRVV